MSSMPETMLHPIEPDAALARKNMRLALALVVIFLLLFAGTFGIAYVYNWLA